MAPLEECGNVGWCIPSPALENKRTEDDNLGYGIFEKVDKDLGLGRGTAWDASGWKDYCDFGFGDVLLQFSLNTP